MKRHVFCIIAVLTLLFSYKVFSEPITFNNHEWYSTPKEVEDTDAKCDIACTSIIKIIDQETGVMKTIMLVLDKDRKAQFFGSSSPVIYRAILTGDQVAGFQLGYTCYHYIMPESGKCTGEYQQLYMAQYCFKDDRFSNDMMFEELSKKLTSLYGTPEILSDTHHIWRDSDHNIAIVLDDSIEGSVVYDDNADRMYRPNSAYMNTLTLTYVAPDAEKRFEEAIKEHGAVKYDEWEENIEKERLNNMNGL